MATIDATGLQGDGQGNLINTTTGQVYPKGSFTYTMVFGRPTFHLANGRFLTMDGQEHSPYENLIKGGEAFAGALTGASALGLMGAGAGSAIGSKVGSGSGSDGTQAGRFDSPVSPRWGAYDGSGDMPSVPSSTVSPRWGNYNGSGDPQSFDLMGSLGDAGSVLGKQAGGAAAGRANEAALGLQADQVAIERFKAAQDQYQAAAHDALRGGLLQGGQDVSISGLPSGVHMGTITGGLRPSAIAGRQDLGAQLQRDALLKMMGGMPTVPTPTPLPQRSGAETAAGALGTGLQLLGAFRKPKV